ncbi:uncharacterized protein LOC106866540 isoform X2 [Brachypodium distachyon]|uniref:uncharacterized protein LOC106866540 isoform X2 n=1 Tax=Brachypodium distachyon TaxID=15368 RepID=UPI000D0D0034|nr:uncharacterized protein LOC106866540 isoform X2 [Brachypodium distachyon]|eukprot:XP_024313753.1 uncharacterized protein LOC106866540 isoform X2 [Brachypodium distachyon]
MQEMTLPLKVTALPAAGRARASVAHQLLSRCPPLALTLRPATARLLLRLRRRTRIPPQHSIANCSTLGPDHSQGSHSNASYTVAVEQLWNIMDPEHVRWSKIGYCNRSAIKQLQLNC